MATTRRAAAALAAASSSSALSSSSRRSLTTAPPSSPFSSSSPVQSSSPRPPLRAHLVFGANTDVGKTVITAGLVRACLLRRLRQLQSRGAAGGGGVHYVKPLQCGGPISPSDSFGGVQFGGADASFVARHATLGLDGDSLQLLGGSGGSPPHFTARTLYRWETAASPHLASRWENKPVSDMQVLRSLGMTLESLLPSNADGTDGSGGGGGDGSSGDGADTVVWIETAGGVLSPSSSSPENSVSPGHSHSRGTESWGWSTQADLYRPLALPAPDRASPLPPLSAVLVGDGRLGGISCTVSALESLLMRGYDVRGVVLLEDDMGGDDWDGCGSGNAEAVREYIACNTGQVVGERNWEEGVMSCLSLDPNRSVISLPPLPPPTEPLDGWYANPVVEATLDGWNAWLEGR